MDELIFEEIDIEDKKEMLGQIMDIYGQDILRLVYSYVQDKSIAEDLTQEIFVKCYKSFHTYQQNSKFRTWLWRIAINHCKDFIKSWYYRKVQSMDCDFSQFSADDTNVEKSIIQKDEDAILAAAVMELPIQYKEVIYLFILKKDPLKIFKKSPVLTKIQ